MLVFPTVLAHGPFPKDEDVSKGIKCSTRDNKCGCYPCNWCRGRKNEFRTCRGKDLDQTREFRQKCRNALDFGHGWDTPYCCCKMRKQKH